MNRISLHLVICMAIYLGFTVFYELFQYLKVLDTIDWIRMLLLDHPFKDYKAVSYLDQHHQCSFVKDLGGEECLDLLPLHKILEEHSQTSILYPLFWLRNSQPIKDHSLNYLVANWNHLSILSLVKLFSTSFRLFLINQDFFKSCKLI